MVINKKFFKQRILMILDMLICLICALFVSVIFYKIELISNFKTEMIVVSIFLLPLTMVVSMIFFNGYKKTQEMNDSEFNRCMLAIFLGIIIYIVQDFVFQYYQLVAYKVISALISGIGMIQLRIIKSKANAKKNKVLDGKIYTLTGSSNVDGFIDEVLGSYNISLDQRKANRFFQGKCIMLVGGAGFIGNNLTMKLAGYQCKRIVIVDIDDNSLYELKRRVEQYTDGCIDIATEIASIRDYKKMDNIFAKYRPDIVYCGAAHKNIELTEQCLEEAVKNNIFGTHTCAKLADIYRVDRFILMSDIYANSPNSIFGATKRVSELIMNYMSVKTKRTKFTTVRFNNVLGSRGSVLAVFDDQINNGGPITVNNKNVSKRYIRVEEAVENIIKVCMLSKGNDTYILDGGKEIIIKNLAQKFVKYKGLKLNKDIKIEYTGEKVYENIQDIGAVKGKRTEYSNLYVVDNESIETSEFYKKLNILNVAAKENDKDNVYKILMEILCLFDGNEYMTIEEINVVDDTQQKALKIEEFYDEAL